MQDLTASPRDTLTAAQVKALLNADALEVEPGLELLNSEDAVIADISKDLVTGEVERNNYANVHGTVRLAISRTLSWASERVRPYVTLTDGIISARFNLGVYALQAPERKMGEDVETWDVSGKDKISLLQTAVGDTYTVESGTYLDAVKAAIQASGAGTRVNIGGSAVSTTISSPMVWALSEDEPVTWLRVVNDLLAKIGYAGLWADPNGYFTSAPYVSPLQRGAEWDLTVDDPRTSLVSEDRTERRDDFAPVNSWRFVQKNSPTAPTDGAGIYLYTNETTGPYSASALGRTLRKVVYLDAADHASLVAQGDAIIREDLQFSHTLGISTAPIPHAGHFDVLSYTDSALGATLKTQARSWTLPLDGSDMTWTLEVL